MKIFKKLICVILSVLLIAGTTLSGASALLNVTDNIAQLDITELDKMCVALREKIAECNEKGISTQYQNSRADLLELFCGYLRQDAAAGQSYYTESVTRSLNEIYTDTMDVLDSYLDGSEKPISSPLYKTGTITIDGDNLYATYDGDGTKKTYFVGFGHGGQVINDMEKLSDMGFNAVQVGIGPANVITEKNAGSRDGLNEDDNFSVDTSYIDNVIVPTLKKAESCNMAVSLLITPHYFPTFLYDLYPDLKNENKGFQKYNIFHPVAMRVIETYVNVLVPKVKDCKSLLEICLINEPHYKSCKSEYDIPAWQEYLKEKYASVKDINKLWKTDYECFEDVLMPQAEQATPLMYEWVQFNDAYYLKWHKWYAQLVKAQAPDVRVSAKSMSYTDNASQRIMYGVNVEQFDSFSDMNGCNAWNTMYDDNTWEKLAAYDIMDSIADKPIINSEDHIVVDYDTGFYGESDSHNYAKHCYADVFQGAVHGRNAVMYWNWERSYDENNYCISSIMSRPLAAAAMSDAALDVSRLSEQLDALNDASNSPDVYILFSDTTRVYSRMFTDFVELAYKGSVYSGKTVRFVSETSIKNMQDGKLLIVPNCTNVTADCLSAIRAYLEKGNEVLVLGQCLKKDEYDNEANLSDVAYIYTHAKIKGSNPISKGVEILLKIIKLFINTAEKLGIDIAQDSDLDYAITKNIIGMLYSPTKIIINADTVQSYIVSLTGESDITVKSANGYAVKNCEIRFTEYNGKMLINICNYDWDNISENVSVYYKGTKLGSMNELISDKEVENSLTLEPHTPLLLEANI